MNEVDERIARISALTDSAGAFTAIVDVPQHVALGAMVTVTSMAGESHDTNCFVPGKPYYISADFPEKYQGGGRRPDMDSSRKRDGCGWKARWNSG